MGVLQPLATKYPQIWQTVHRSARTFELDAILAVRYERTLSKDCTVQVQRDVYLVDDPAAYRGARITVIEHPSHGFQLRLEGRTVRYQRLRSLTEQGHIRDAKSLNDHLDRRQREPMPQMARPVPANHPWRSFRLPGSPPPT